MLDTTSPPGPRKSTASAQTVASLWRLALAGKTRAEAAQALQISYGHVAAAAHHYRIPFRHGKQTPTTKRPRQKHPIGRVKAAGLIDALDLSERLDFVTLVRRGGYTPEAAFHTLKRPDLAARAAELEQNA